jgi:hypothetical protein
MHFSSDFEIALQDILVKLSLKAVSKCGEKGAKSKCLEFWDIPKQLEKLDFDCVDFSSDFLSRTCAVSISTAARAE